MMPLISDPNQTQDRLCVIGEADPFLARLLERYLEKSGFQTRRAQTGEAVLNLVTRDRPVLIILEPELPGKVRGWEAVRTLKTDRVTGDIPIILCAWLKEDAAQALTGQAFAYLQKPDLHYEDFAAVLNSANIKTTLDESKKTGYSVPRSF